MLVLKVPNIAKLICNSLKQNNISQSGNENIFFICMNAKTKIENKCMAIRIYLLIIAVIQTTYAVASVKLKSFFLMLSFKKKTTTRI